MPPHILKPIPNNIQTDRDAIEWVKALSNEMLDASWPQFLFNLNYYTQTYKLLEQFENKIPINTSGYFIDSIFGSNNSINTSMKLLNEEFQKEDLLNLAQHALWPLIDKISQTYSSSTEQNKTPEDFDVELFNNLVKSYSKHRINLVQACLKKNDHLNWVNNILSSENRESLKQTKNIFDDKMILVDLNVSLESSLALCKVISVPHREHYHFVFWKKFPEYYYHFSLPKDIQTDEAATKWIQSLENKAIKQSYPDYDQEGKLVFPPHIAEEVYKPGYFYKQD